MDQFKFEVESDYNEFVIGVSGGKSYFREDYKYYFSINILFMSFKIKFTKRKK